jgi:hypothetical protein
MASLLFSFPFRAGLAQNFLLDSLWSWSACLEPLSLVPHCVALFLSSKDGNFHSFLSSSSSFPVLTGLGRLVGSLTAVVFWVYVTEARRTEYRGISGLILLCQSVGVCGAVLLSALSLKAEVVQRKLGLDKPLLTLLTKAESAKAQ